MNAAILAFLESRRNLRFTTCKYNVMVCIYFVNMYVERHTEIVKDHAYIKISMYIIFKLPYPHIKYAICFYMILHGALP